MMALDFFSSSSSESTAFGGLAGGRAASRFTEVGITGGRTHQIFFSSNLPSLTGSRALKTLDWEMASPTSTHPLSFPSPQPLTSIPPTIPIF